MIWNFCSVFAVDFYPKKAQTKWAFPESAKAFFQLLFCWIHPSQLRSINTTNQLLQPLNEASQLGGSLQWERPTVNHSYVSQLRVDLPVDQKHLGQRWIYLFCCFCCIIWKDSASFRSTLSSLPQVQSIVASKNTRRKCICVWSRVWTEVVEDDPSLRR